MGRKLTDPKPKATKKKAAAKKKPVKNGNATEAAPGESTVRMGHNVVVRKSELEKLLKRRENLKEEADEFREAMNDKIDTLVTQGAVELNVPKRSLRQFFGDHLANLAWERKRAERQEKDPDGADGYDRLAAAMEGTPMGDFAKAKAAEAAPAAEEATA